MSGERCVVTGECVCEMLCEMSEMSGVRTATPNAIYTRQGAKPACQEDINAKFSHLLLAHLPRTHFTHSTAPNPHARKTSTQNFCISYWRTYPEHTLHRARRQTRVSARHQCKIFAPPIGTDTPNTVYAQQGAKPACQQDINAKFSHLLLAQLPRTQFTRSKAPKPRVSNTSAQIFWHLLLAQLPGTHFTHPRASGDQARRNNCLAAQTKTAGQRRKL